MDGGPHRKPYIILMKVTMETISFIGCLFKLTVVITQVSIKLLLHPVNLIDFPLMLL